MRIGAENKKKLITMSVLLALVIPLAIYNYVRLFGGSSSRAPSSPATAGQAKKSTSAAVAQDPGHDPRLRLDILDASRRVKYEPGRDIFHMQAPPPPKPIASVRPEVNLPTPSPTPTPLPPIPLKYYGYVATKPGEPRKVFLADESGQRQFIVGQGDIVDRRYRLVQIQANSVEMEDVLTNNRQPIKLTSNQLPPR